MDDNLIFSLDIGTRTIIGLVGEYLEDGSFKLLALSMKEHEKRNMHSGQIHDIEGVAQTVKAIVDDLESQINKKLKVVSIAAAGRALQTQRAFIEKEIGHSREISKEDIEALELEAVQKAQEEVNNGPNEDLKYYSIGYTVVDYYLDEYRMDNLYGHKGEKIGLEVLATFLPQIVIESLYSVIAKVGLEVGSITLEPIAAINIAIPEELRLLNLALVDIGAGTSDIALTKEGQIISYAMTSTAGDDISESLAKAYLLDFNSSEKLKVQLSQQDEHEFQDILGISHNMTRGEIVEGVQATIDYIASEIAEKILEYNSKAPDAVFLIGGSSQMPGLRDSIAEKLGLAKERVSIRDISTLNNLEGLTEKGPNMITPIGIAMEGAKDQYRNFIRVNFNGKEVRLFNTDSIRVSDILVLTGFNPRDLLAKRGESFIYYLNGKKRRILGSQGTMPQLLVNGIEGDLKTPVDNGTEIELIPSVLEEKAAPYIYDIVPREKNIYYENRAINLIKSIRVNGDLLDENIRLAQESQILVEEIKSLADFIAEYGDGSGDFLVNGERKALDYELKVNDTISKVKSGPEKALGEADSIEASQEIEEASGKVINLTINDEEMAIPYDKEDFIFVDVFNHIDFNLSAVKGSLVLRVNGQDAEYMQVLQDGDVIEVFWE